MNTKQLIIDFCETNTCFNQNRVKNMYCNQSRQTLINLLEFIEVNHSDFFEGMCLKDLIDIYETITYEKLHDKITSIDFELILSAFNAVNLIEQMPQHYFNNDMSKYEFHKYYFNNLHNDFKTLIPS